MPTFGGRPRKPPAALTLAPGEDAALLEVEDDPQDRAAAAALRIYTAGPEKNLLLQEASERGERIRPGRTLASVRSVADGYTEVDVTKALAEGERRFALAAAPLRDGEDGRPVSVSLGSERPPALVLTEGPSEEWALTGPQPEAGSSAAQGGDEDGPEVTIEDLPRSSKVAVTPLLEGRLSSEPGAEKSVQVGIWAGAEPSGAPLTAPAALVEGERWTLLRPLPRGEWTLVAIQLGRGGTVGASEPVTLTVTAEPTVAAAGDIACEPENVYFNDGEGDQEAQQCRMKAVSDRILESDPSAVLALGDIQYLSGEPEDYRRSWDPTWGVSSR